VAEILPLRHYTQMVSETDMMTRHWVHSDSKVIPGGLLTGFLR